MVKLSIFFKLITNRQSLLMFRLLKMSNEFYRACFISAALSQGIYEEFVEGKTSFDNLSERLNMTSNREGLRAWLELGVSLGELRRIKEEYQIKGRFSKALLKSDHDAHKAFLEEIVRYYYNYIVNTPSMLKEHRWFSFDESVGELIARSSRVSEPFIFQAVDTAIPPKGQFYLLEIGCGSGIYIQRVCARNPDLRAVGLELQQGVAALARSNMKSWGLESRVTIEHGDVRNYSSDRKFDLITLHQNIYYFPVKDRENLFRHLIDCLKPGGRVLLTTICQGGSPTMQALNIWVSTTEGFGPLPYPDQLCQQFIDSGFEGVRKMRLVPFESFWAFVATKSNL